MRVQQHLAAHQAAYARYSGGAGSHTAPLRAT